MVNSASLEEREDSPLTPSLERHPVSASRFKNNQRVEIKNGRREEGTRLTIPLSIVGPYGDWKPSFSATDKKIGLKFVCHDRSESNRSRGIFKQFAI